MPSNRPLLSTLITRVRQDFLDRSETGDAVLRNSPENALARVLSGTAHGLYGFINYVFLQVIPNAESDLDSILRWANAFLTVPQTAASLATGTATFTGTDGTNISAGVALTTTDGQAYTTDALVTVASGIAQVSVTADVAGVDGNQSAGAAITLATPISGVDSEGTVDAGGLAGGADEEGKLSILDRLFDRFRNPPRGGATGDYASWAKESSAAVTRAFEFPLDPEAGFVKVVILDDNQPDLQPSASTLATAQTNVDLYRPVHMGGAPVIAPTSTDMALTLANLNPDTAGNRTAVETAISAYVLAATEPGLALQQSDVENAAQNTAGLLSGPDITSPAPGAISPTGDYGIFNSFTITWVPASPP